MIAVYVRVATQSMKPIVIKMTAVYVLVITLMILDVAVLNLAHLDVMIHVVLP